MNLHSLGALDRHAPYLTLAIYRAIRMTSDNGEYGDPRGTLETVWYDHQTQQIRGHWSFTDPTTAEVSRYTIHVHEYDDGEDTERIRDGDDMGLPGDWYLFTSHIIR